MSAVPSVGRAAIPRVLISAYAASPAFGSWDPVLEAELLPALCALEGVAGLEVPWLGALHPHDDEWFLRNVPVGASLALTALPYVMRRCSADPGYGIASPDADGRAAALDDVRRIAADVRVLTERSGAVVAVVNLHTAPRGGADATALEASLMEISELDWCGAELVIEHCDAPVPGRAFEKGFLPVEAEITAVSATGVPVGIWLNWGRSAIELRDPAAVTAQIAEVGDSGLLAGLTFSGAGAVDGPYGAAWADAHLPILSADPASGSMLDDAALRAALGAAATVPWLGVKVSRRPEDRTATDVVRTVARNLALVCAARLSGEVIGPRNHSQ